MASLHDMRSRNSRYFTRSAMEPFPFRLRAGLPSNTSRNRVGLQSNMFRCQANFCRDENSLCWIAIQHLVQYAINLAGIEDCRSSLFSSYLVS